MIKVNQRIRTQYGTGTIVGFECFDKDGNEVMGTVDNGEGRILVELDPDHTWLFKGGLYAAFRYDLENGKCEVLDQ